ncbi:serine/arginine-rich splicing factor 10-like [Hydractinia symbiolongicarpus]|uniref:serine/arginine-rich splicing factor 10-like n=1 Tax=Hydractinia symbiolongicarpus TaxID=13093 RepID=UPI00254A719B|nr:serine/arginine-rich splicing factor 10-like [Hydractinia symbiolongicarpus]
MSRRGKTTTSVYVRNIHHDVVSDDLRKMFSKYGPLSDVYVPLDYYTREPRGFAYVQFDYVEDAEDAVHYLDGTTLFGRALEVQIAQGDRKTPSQMRYRGGGSGGPRRGRRSFSRSRSRSRSPRRRPRRRSYSRSRSRSPPRHASRSRSRSPPRRSRSRSRSH